MTLKQLEELIADARLRGIDDDSLVLIPVNQEFDGALYSPCVEESGFAECGIEDFDEDEIAERQLLNKPIEKAKDFILVPCVYFEEKDHSHEMN
jgi:hypothetical protein